MRVVLLPPPQAQLAAMGKVAEMLRQPLDHVTTSYVTRFRLAAERKPMPTR